MIDKNLAYYNLTILSLLEAVKSEKLLSTSSQKFLLDDIMHSLICKEGVGEYDHKYVMQTLITKYKESFINYLNITYGEVKMLYELEGKLNEAMKLGYSWMFGTICVAIMDILARKWAEMLGIQIKNLKGNWKSVAQLYKEILQKMKPEQGSKDDLTLSKTLMYSRKLRNKLIHEGGEIDDKELRTIFETLTDLLDLFSKQKKEQKSIDK